MLKVLGTLESSLDIQQWRRLLQRRGWSVSSQTERAIARKRACHLEVEGQGLALIHGQIGNQGQDLEELQELLLSGGQQLQMDVFEEDGRMIKRISM